MRPLSTKLKAACFFYVGFLIIMVVIQTMFSFHASILMAGEAANADYPVWKIGDLIGLHDELNETWHQLINTSGFNRIALEEELQTKLMSGQNQKEEYQWVYSQSRLILPQSQDETVLVNLGNQWKKVIEDKGLTIDKIRWGYQDKRLWLKIQSKISISITDNQKKHLPIYDITLIQHLIKDKKEKWNWRGLIPEVQPQPKTAPAPSVSKETQPEPKKEDVPPKKPSEVKPSPKPSKVVEPVLPSPKIPPTPKPDKTGLPPIKKRARVAIIIDDVGFERKASEKMLGVPARLTWSVLPLSPYGKEYAVRAQENGFEIMLHLPMEPLSPKENPGPGVIRREWDETEILRQLQEDLDFVSLAKGANNHMGSAGTADDRLMDILMKEFKRRGLFFVDSYTDSHSIAEKYARKYGVPFGKRRVFIDHVSDYDVKIKQLRQVINIALKEGSAIAIGHVREGTPEAIMEMLPEFIKAGIEIVPVSELVR